ncbi:alpha/beta hydrolase [Planomonospora sp. ID82291]|uniref:alpha/beta hydrolase n=1 Tax=Planomonospora sp. ID82291 TaxID=2738136 RepID=UPI0018C38DF4|nr:alpha/beta hydrolase [Planomonospora sp. ID82291]MBG0818764.1 alpha/beta hydrolase [Planomonospora sp. ID82291]
MFTAASAPGARRATPARTVRWRLPRAVTAIAAAVTVTLLSGLAAAPSSAATASAAGRDVTVHKDIAYAPAQLAGSRGHLLDLYVPEQRGRARRPVLIVTGGSAWRRDNGKDFAAQIAPHFTAAGYVVAGVSVRSTSQAQFPAQLHDAKAAVRWLRAHAARYRIDPHRFAMMGDSSGGWATTMVAVTGDVPALEGAVGVTGVSSKVQAAVNLYGPTNFLRMDRHMLPGACAAFNKMMGTTDCHNDEGSPESQLVGCAIKTCPEKVREANPITYVSRNDPPFLIAHGQDDQLVPHNQSQALYWALKRACATATFYSVPGVGHSTGILSPDVTRPQVTSTSRCRNTPVPYRASRPTLRTIQSFLEASWSRARH